MKSCHLCKCTDLRWDEAGQFYRCMSCWSVVLKEDA